MKTKKFMLIVKVNVFCRSKDGKLQSLHSSAIRKLCTSSKVYATASTTARKIKKRNLRGPEKRSTSLTARTTSKL